jgi:hypothetical protein
MVRFKPSIWFVVPTVVNGCSAYLGPPPEQEPRRVEQKEEQRGQLQYPRSDIAQAAGLMIEGR